MYVSSLIVVLVERLDFIIDFFFVVGEDIIFKNLVFVFYFDGDLVFIFFSI